MVEVDQVIPLRPLRHGLPRAIDVANFHRPFRDPQHGSGLPVLPADPEARHDLEPAPLPRVSLDAGQATAPNTSARPV
ncbi:hypothetical protein SSBG_04060 [Streptomyces sp. SPB074]|nr:hypothetical protein SSBG_04060 [Streptomyces sp. SPB074]